MNYLAYSFTIEGSAETIQLAQDWLPTLLGEAGFEAFEESANGLTGYVQPTLLNADLLEESLQSLPFATTYIINKVEDRDWNETWEQAGFEPICIGNELVVYDANQGVGGVEGVKGVREGVKGVREGVKGVREGVKGVREIAIQARQAFGTGTHETTQLMLSQLCQRPLEGKRVLDAGCGTGILGIAASLLGAADVVGYDVDEWSVENTKHNAELNHVQNLQVWHGDASVLNQVEGLFDVVLANINRNILLADMPAFVSKMKPEATLLLSGFYAEDVPLLIEKAESLHLQLAKKTEKDGWNCLLFKTQ